MNLLWKAREAVVAQVKTRWTRTPRLDALVTARHRARVDGLTFGRVRLTHAKAVEAIAVKRSDRIDAILFARVRVLGALVKVDAG